MFVRVVSKAKWRMPLLALAATAVMAVLMKWPQATATGVSRGLSICTTVIIPSLFPFLVVSGFVVKAGIGQYIGMRLEKPIRWLFGLPGCAACAIVLGFIGGYPAGSIATCELLKQGAVTNEQAKRMLRFCVCGGPAFVISAVGVGMLGSRAYGTVLFVAHVLAACIIGIAGRRSAKSEPAPLPIATKPSVSVSTALVDAVNNACRSLLYMCGFVVLFAAILSLADAMGITALIRRLLSAPFGQEIPALKSIFPLLLEVSCGCLEAVSSGAATPLMLGLAIGWGGLSVHCQIAATVNGEKLLDSGFWGARALHGLLTGIIATGLLRIWPISVSTGTAGNTIVQPFAGSAVSAVALLAVCAMLLLVTENGRTKLKIDIAKRR